MNLHEPLNIDAAVLIKQQKITQFCVDTGCRLEDLPGVMGVGRLVNLWSHNNLYY